jgi:cellulose synthase/poly-beta-1,6-N-acetylglucosamine synthase-like glycosyltransferase
VVGLTRGAWWAAVGTLAYTFLVFPVIVAVRAVIAPRPYRSGSREPTVSLVIAARNEAAGIRAKLANLDQLDYPEDRLEVILASDGSEDDTERWVADHPGRRIRLLRLPHEGKAAALNAAVREARGEILVFSDANSLYAPDAIRKLVDPFADPAIGGVAGNQRYRSSAAAEGTAEGERAYWGFDRLLKVGESRAGSTISATGAIYAIRRDLFRDVPPGVTDDFYTSVSVIAQGFRLVFVPNAVAWEEPAQSGRGEFRRKVRVMTRGLRAIVLHRSLLDPRTHGFYAVQLLSHKLLRRLMWAPLIVLMVTSPALWRRGPIYRLATVVQGTFYGLAVIGLVPGRRARLRLVDLPAYFCLAMAASLVASWNLLRGRQIDRWEPTSKDRR